MRMVLSGFSGVLEIEARCHIVRPSGYDDGLLCRGDQLL